MTRLEDRQTLLHALEEARAAGARLAPACALAGIDPRTAQRWQTGDSLARGDRRPDAERPTPSHALTAAERARIIAVANEPRFAETPPARIVPALADEGTYIASESSFHRVLRAAGQMNRRGRARPPPAVTPAEHACRDPPRRGLVLGHDLSAGPGAGAMVLSLSHPRSVQPQGRRLRGA
jgi:putative transposase